jgi:hypothetical protein
MKFNKNIIIEIAVTLCALISGVLIGNLFKYYGNVPGAMGVAICVFSFAMAIIRRI